MRTKCVAWNANRVTNSVLVLRSVASFDIRPHGEERAQSARVSNQRADAQDEGDASRRTATRDRVHDLKQQGANAPRPGESGRRAALRSLFPSPKRGEWSAETALSNISVRAQGAERAPLRSGAPAPFGAPRRRFLAGGRFRDRSWCRPWRFSPGPLGVEMPSARAK